MKKKAAVEKIDKFARLYRGFKLIVRPGSMDFMKYPTRIGNTLFYIDNNGNYQKSKKDNERD